MSTALNKQTVTAQAYQIVCWQLIVIMGLALVVSLLQGIQSGLSAFIGSLAYCLPNFAFVRLVFARVNARAVQRFIVTFFAGEALKLLLSAVLFVIAVNYLPVHFFSVLIGYIGAIIAFWVASLIFASREQQDQGVAS